MEQPVSTYSRVVLITGASTGIGLALSKKLYHSSYRTVATARSASLERLAKEGLTETENFLIRPLDVTNWLEQQQLINEIKNTWGNVDILINNAGITYRSVIEHLHIDDEQDQFLTIACSGNPDT